MPYLSHLSYLEARMRPAQRRWTVRVSHFPLGLPGRQLGTVWAHDRADAEAKAGREFAAPFTVEPYTTDTSSVALTRALRQLERKRGGVTNRDRRRGAR